MSSSEADADDTSSSSALGDAGKSSDSLSEDDEVPSESDTTIDNDGKTEDSTSGGDTTPSVSVSETSEKSIVSNKLSNDSPNDVSDAEPVVSSDVSDMGNSSDTAAASTAPKDTEPEPPSENNVAKENNSKESELDSENDIDAMSDDVSSTPPPIRVSGAKDKKSNRGKYSPLLHGHENTLNDQDSKATHNDAVVISDPDSDSDSGSDSDSDSDSDIDIDMGSPDAKGHAHGSYGGTGSPSTPPFDPSANPTDIDDEDSLADFEDY